MGLGIWMKLRALIAPLMLYTFFPSSGSCVPSASCQLPIQVGCAQCGPPRAPRRNDRRLRRIAFRSPVTGARTRARLTSPSLMASLQSSTRHKRNTLMYGCCHAAMKGTNGEHRSRPRAPYFLTENKSCCSDFVGASSDAVAHQARGTLFGACRPGRSRRQERPFYCALCVELFSQALRRHFGTEPRRQARRTAAFLKNECARQRPCPAVLLLVFELGLQNRPAAFKNSTSRSHIAPCPRRQLPKRPNAASSSPPEERDPVPDRHDHVRHPLICAKARCRQSLPPTPTHGARGRPQPGRAAGRTGEDPGVELPQRHRLLVAHGVVSDLSVPQRVVHRDDPAHAHLPHKRACAGGRGRSARAFRSGQKAGEGAKGFQSLASLRARQGHELLDVSGVGALVGVDERKVEVPRLRARCGVGPGPPVAPSARRRGGGAERRGGGGVEGWRGAPRRRREGCRGRRGRCRSARPSAFEARGALRRAQARRAPALASGEPGALGRERTQRPPAPRPLAVRSRCGAPCPRPRRRPSSPARSRSPCRCGRR